MFNAMFSHRGSALKYALCAVLALVSLAASAKDYRLADGEIIRDPTEPGNFKPIINTVRPAPSFKLSYVLASSDRKYAIINGKKVHEGDTVTGARVVSIDGKGVELISRGQRKRLSLNSVSGIKRKP